MLRRWIRGAWRAFWMPERLARRARMQELGRAIVNGDFDPPSSPAPRGEVIPFPTDRR